MKTGLGRSRIAWMAAGMVLMGLVSGRAGEIASARSPVSDSLEEARPKGESEMQRRQAMMQERRNESEKLHAILQSDTSTVEEKRKAAEEFRTKSEAWRGAMLKEIPQTPEEEKAVLMQRMKERINQLPEERRKAMESQWVISEEMEKLRSEEKTLSLEERRTRMQALMERRRDAMKSQSAATEVEAARAPKDSPEASQGPLRQAMEAEKQKLDVALETNDPEKRRAAMESFRVAMDKMRDARLQEIEQRRNEAISPPAATGRLPSPLHQ